MFPQSLSSRRGGGPFLKKREKWRTRLCYAWLELGGAMSEKVGLLSNLPALSKYLREPEFKMPVITPISVQHAESFQKGIREVIEKLQAGLKPDEQLQVFYTNGVEVIRVGHIYMSSTNVAVVSGIDSEGNPAQVISHFHALQFVSKIVKVDQKIEKTKIGFSVD